MEGELLEDFSYENVEAVWNYADYALYWVEEGTHWVGLSVLAFHETTYDPDMEDAE